VAGPRRITTAQRHRAASSGIFEFELETQIDTGPILLATSPDFAPSVLIGTPGANQVIVLAPGHSIRLQIIGANGEPLTGASADLVPLYICTPILAEFQNDLIRRETSRDDGRMEFSGVPPGAYALRVRAHDHALGVALPLVIKRDIEEFRIWLPPGRSLQGRIEPPPGLIPPHGMVAAVWRSGHGILHWSSAEFGPDNLDFVLENLPTERSVRIVATSQNGMMSRVMVIGSDTIARGRMSSPLSLVFPKSWPLRISGSAAHQPVYVHPSASQDIPFLNLDEVKVLTTDANGSLFVGDIPAPVESLRIVQPGRGYAEIRLDRDETSKSAEILLQPARTLEGALVASDLSALPEARIWAATTQGLDCETRTTREGRFACALPMDSTEQPSLYAATEGGSLPLAVRPASNLETFIMSPGRPLNAMVVQGQMGMPAENLVMRVERVPIARKYPGDETSVGFARLFARTPAGRLSIHLAPGAPLRLGVGLASSDPITPLTLRQPSAPSGKPATLMIPGTQTLSGSVVSTDSSQPIPEAAVLLRTHRTAPGDLLVERMLHSDLTGAWFFEDVTPGSYRLAASADGYVPWQTVVSVHSGRANGSHRISMDPAGVVRGLVIGTSPDARVIPFLVGRSPDAQSGPRRGEADTSGRFTFKNVRPGVYIVDLRIERDAGGSFLSRSSTPVEVRGGEVSHVEFDLGGGVLLFGTSFVGGNAAIGARLSFWLSDEKTPGSTATFTDHEGRYEVHLPGPGVYVVHVIDEKNKLEGQSRLEIDISRAGRQRRDLHFTASGIQGRVLDPNGGPIVRAEVSLERLSQESGDIPNASRTRKRFISDAQTGEDGGFDFPGLPAGRYRVQMRAEGFAPRLEGPIELKADVMAQLGDIVLTRGFALEVLAVGPAGERLPGAIIGAFRGGEFNEAPRHISAGVSAADGKALIKDLEPGEYALVGFHSELAPSILDGVLIPPDPAMGTANLRFTRGGTLEIQVVGKDGTPQIGAAVRVVDERGWDLTYTYKSVSDSSAPSFTDAQGRLVLNAVRPGMYRIDVFKVGSFNPQTVQIREGENTKTYLIAD
jgi:hypothetical protein